MCICAFNNVPTPSELDGFEDEEVFEEVKVHVRPFVDREEISNRKANDIYRMVNKEVRLVHDVAPHDARASSHA